MKLFHNNENELLYAPTKPLIDYVNAKQVQDKPKQENQSGSVCMRVALVLIGFGLCMSILWSASNAI